jgi:hypothetical protein
LNAKHTPGPWKVVPFSDPSKTIPHIMATSQSQTGHPIEIAVLWASAVDSPEECIANARLIAAAPDLLAAMKDMLSGWRYIRRNHGDLYGVGWDRCENSARAAIAKAGGVS